MTAAWLANAARRWIKALPLEPLGNIRCEIRVRPDGNGTVTIVLPVAADCEADGAICKGG